MKKLIKTLSILMMSVMLILPAAVSTHAEEVNNDTNEVVEYNTNGAILDNSKTNPNFSKLARAFSPNATINANGVRIRKGPSTSATIAGLLYNGDRVKAYYQAYGDGKWFYYIETESGIKGYVVTSYLTFD